MKRMQDDTLRRRRWHVKRKDQSGREVLLTASNLDLASLRVEGVLREIHVAVDIQREADRKEDLGTVAQSRVDSRVDGIEDLSGARVPEVECRDPEVGECLTSQDETLLRIKGTRQAESLVSPDEVEKDVHPQRLICFRDPVEGEDR